jgi:diadenylate cyclase
VSELFEPLTSQISKLTPVAILDILVVAVLIYQVFAMIRGRRSAHILVGLGILIVVYVASSVLNFELLRSILAYLAPYTAIALVVMFQSELRRVFARLGRRRWLTLGSRLQRREFADEILLALKPLSDSKTGALIVVERDIGLRTFIESGVPMDASISRDLLLAIFQHNGALHDGAVIVQADRIAAAACFLPLSMNPNIMRKMGTRHRAAIGITEETDCLGIVVSEESGRISVAAFGEIEPDLTIDRVEERIVRHFSRRGGDAEGARPRNLAIAVPAPHRESNAEMADNAGGLRHVKGS